MVEEKLVVEFGVEETIDKDYGYQEKKLLYNGERIPYKAILKDGELIAIVSRKYSLIPNEQVAEVAEKFAEENQYEISIVDEFPRIYIKLMQGRNGYLISNSVDGSLSLRVDLIHNGVYMPITALQFKRRHVGSIDVKTLELLIKECQKTSAKLTEFLENMQEVELDKEIFETINNKIPKKFRVDYNSMKLDRTVITLKDFFEAATSKIWSSNASYRRKTKLIQKICKYISVVLSVR